MNDINAADCFHFLRFHCQVEATHVENSSDHQSASGSDNRTGSIGTAKLPAACRGGGSMRSRSHSGNAQHTYNILGLFFDKGNRAAGLGLAPGQCSWLDRGMRNGEPDILQQEVRPNVTSALWFQDMKNPSKYWTFNVFNTNQGVMKVTGAFPGRRLD